MTVTELSTELTDPELISRVRDGDVDAYGTLFARHIDAANRLARMLVGGPDADDLVSDAFVKVLNVLLGGGGPDVAFRAYLLTAVRRLHVDRARSQQRLTTTGDLTPYDPGVPFTDTAVAGFEGGAAAKAFASLPERWQMVLWHLEVENQKPADIAPLLGMSANSVSALAYRARERLRQAFLTMHAGDLVSDECAATHELLGGYVRDGLSRRDTTKVDEHLEHCRRCTAAYLELADVNSSLAALLAPALLGSAAAAYVGSGAAGATGTGGLILLAGRLRDFVVGNVQAFAVGGTAVGVAGVAAVVVATTGPDVRPVTRDQPAVGSPALRAPSASLPKPRRTPPPAPTSRATARIPHPRHRATSPSPALPSPSPSASTHPVPAQHAATAAAQSESATTKPDPLDAVAPSPRPTATPTPHPKSTPTSDPTPDSPPPPPPPPPPSKQADVRLTSTRTADANRITVRVSVDGLPAGTSVQLSATVDKGNLRVVSGPGCTPSSRGYTCTVTPASRVVVLETNNNSGAGMTFSVGVPQGWTDPATGNNKLTVTAAGKGA